MWVILYCCIVEAYLWLTREKQKNDDDFVVVFFREISIERARISLYTVLHIHCGSFPFVSTSRMASELRARMHAYVYGCERWEFLDVRSVYTYIFFYIFIVSSDYEISKDQQKINIETNYNAPKETEKNKSRRESLYLWIKNNNTE